MKNNPLVVVVAVGVGWVATLCLARAQNGVVSPTSAAALPAPMSTSDDILLKLLAVEKDLQTKIQDDIKNGRRPTEKELAPEVQALDALLAAHKGVKNDALAQVAMAKGILSFDCGKEDLGNQLLNRLIKDYPGTFTAQDAAAFIKSEKGAANYVAEFNAIRRQLVGQPVPDFQIKDLAGLPHSAANYRGEVVLVDFWSTVCAPCLTEMPNVQKVYAKYQGRGFEILGVDEDSDKSDKAKLAVFLKTHNMSWPECYGGDNLISQKFHIMPLPANYLVGRDGKIIGMDLFGDDLDEAVAKALAVK